MAGPVKLVIAGAGMIGRRGAIAAGTVRQRRWPFETFMPLRRQIPRFAEVIGGTEAPLVSGREGLKTLKILAAAEQSAALGRDSVS